MNLERMKSTPSPDVLASSKLGAEVSEWQYRPFLAETPRTLWMSMEFNRFNVRERFRE